MTGTKTGRSKKLWKEADATKAVAEAINGAKIVNLVAKYGIPDKTLRRMIERHKNGVEKRKPGPAPILGKGAEDDLYAWVVAMQRQGYPVSRDVLTAKANAIYHEMHGNLRSSGSIGRGWCDRFFNRYPQLTLRTSQLIKRVRVEVELDEVRVFFNRLIKIMIEESMDGDRVFNMDETGFSQKARNKKVIALAGSSNVWSKTAEANFHMTIVAAASAKGTSLPPVFVVPGMRLNRDVLDECSIPGAKITTAPKGFVNQDLFSSWIRHFSNALPASVKRPILLIYDGCSSHGGDHLAELAAELKIIFLPLPPNTTHLYQPLDVAVFKPFKTCLRSAMQDFMLDTGAVTLNKKQAIKLASTAWQKSVMERPQNIVSGFTCTGLYPSSFVKMQSRLKLFKDGGAKSHDENPVWLQSRQVIRTEILSLPPVPAQKRRKTVDVGKKLLSKEDLNN